MIGEIDLYGVFIPPLLAWGVIALPIMAAARLAMVRIGFYRLVWHRPLVDLSLLVLIIAAIAAFLPRWIAP
jgi:Protein of unknown function (DUF1656)